MTNFSRSGARAFAVVTVVCAPLLVYQLSDFKSVTGTNLISSTGNVLAPDSRNNEPELAAANPVDAQSWTILPNINNGRFEASAIQYRDDLYVFNGFGKGIDVEMKRG